MPIWYPDELIEAFKALRRGRMTPEHEEALCEAAQFERDARPYLTGENSREVEVIEHRPRCRCCGSQWHTDCYDVFRGEAAQFERETRSPQEVQNVGC